MSNPNGFDRYKFVMRIEVGTERRVNQQDLTIPIVSDYEWLKFVAACNAAGLKPDMMRGLPSLPSVTGTYSSWDERYALQLAYLSAVRARLDVAMNPFVGMKQNNQFKSLLSANMILVESALKGEDGGYEFLNKELGDRTTKWQLYRVLGLTNETAPEPFKHLMVDELMSIDPMTDLVVAMFHLRLLV